MNVQSRITPTDIAVGSAAIIFALSLVMTFGSRQPTVTMAIGVVAALVAAIAMLLFATNLSGQTMAEILSKQSVRWDQGDHDYILIVRFQTDAQEYTLKANVNRPCFDTAEEGATMGISYHKTFPRLFRLSGE